MKKHRRLTRRYTKRMYSAFRKLSKTFEIFLRFQLSKFRQYRVAEEFRYYRHALQSIAPAPFIGKYRRCISICSRTRPDTRPKNAADGSHRLSRDNSRDSRALREHSCESKSRHVLSACGMLDAPSLRVSRESRGSLGDPQ